MNNDFITTFIFPFKYERGDAGDIQPKEIATKWLNLNDRSDKGWKREIYSLETADKYNEYYYFHPFVSQAIFNIEDNVGMEYLVRTDYKYLEVEYIYDDINEKEEIKRKKMKLITTDIKSIDLHLFDNQIGLLTITTEKCIGDNETVFPDLLRYNDVARRVYPPFIVAAKDNTGFLKTESQLLPSRITAINANDDKQNISECFESIPLSKENYNDTIYLSGIIKKLLYPFELKEKEIQDKIYYTPFIDDRMFIVSYYASEKLSKELMKRCCDRYEYENSKDWYRFIFVDGNYANIANPDMMRELIQKHTYSRWIGNGTLFGMSRYSLVMAGDNSEFCKGVLKLHMKSIYYQIALIVLFQRAMLLKFSEDIQKATQLFGKDDVFIKLQKDASKLRGEFIRFINKYWFIEVTPQEQGVEMYSQWIGLLNVDKLFKEVQREIEGLDSYVSAKIEAEMAVIENNRNEQIRKITVAGFPLAIVALIFSLWQTYSEAIGKIGERLGIMTIHFQSNKDIYIFNSFIILIPITATAYILARVIANRFMRRKNATNANPK